MKRVALILLLSQHVFGDKVKHRKDRKIGGVHGRKLLQGSDDSLCVDNNEALRWYMNANGVQHIQNCASATILCSNTDQT